MKQFIINFISNNLFFVIAVSIIMILLAFKSKNVRRCLIGGLTFCVFALLVYCLHRYELINDKSYSLVCELIVICFVSFENIIQFIVEFNTRFSFKINYLVIIGIIYYGYASIQMFYMFDNSITNFLHYYFIDSTIIYFKKMSDFINTKNLNNSNVSLSYIALRC